MRVSDHEKKHLLTAMRCYHEGLTHAGDYQLWVGFGDGWTGFRTKLIEGGYLRRNGDGSIRLSPKGVGLFEQIEQIAA